MTWKQAVVFEWGSRSDFLSYWHSDEYAEIKQLRKGTAEFQAAIVEDMGVYLHQMQTLTKSFNFFVTQFKMSEP